MPSRRIDRTDRYNRDFLNRLPRASSVTLVYLIAEPEPCGPCARTAGQHDVSSLPPDPASRCTRKQGCACWFVALPKARRDASPISLILSAAREAA